MYQILCIRDDSAQLETFVGLFEVGVYEGHAIHAQVYLMTGPTKLILPRILRKLRTDRLS